ncbi:MAG: hypothetical protein CM1200mP20_13180 [Pseudomonadota bacterium]|nr:MAG: hypothetical protein CM1200mP20_13180 [Pseudomonadota bacterium]
MLPPAVGRRDCREQNGKPDAECGVRLAQSIRMGVGLNRASNEFRRPHSEKKR